MQRCLMLAILLAAVAGPAHAQEPHACAGAVAAMRMRAAALPEGDLSRRFAETDLANALMELGAGDAEECEELVEHAAHVLETRPYVLRPGEVAHGYGPGSPQPAAAPSR